MTNKDIELLKAKGTYLETDEYRKFLFILRAQFSEVIDKEIIPPRTTPLTRAEFEAIIPQLVETLVAIAEDWGQTIRGIKNKRISYARVKGKKK